MARCVCQRNQRGKCMFVVGLIHLLRAKMHHTHLQVHKNWGRSQRRTLTKYRCVLWFARMLLNCLDNCLPISYCIQGPQYTHSRLRRQQLQEVDLASGRGWSMKDWQSLMNWHSWSKMIESCEAKHSIMLCTKCLCTDAAGIQNQIGIWKQRFRRQNHMMTWTMMIWATPIVSWIQTWFKCKPSNNSIY